MGATRLYDRTDADYLEMEAMLNAGSRSGTFEFAADMVRAPMRAE